MLSLPAGCTLCARVVPAALRVKDNLMPKPRDGRTTTVLLGNFIDRFRRFEARQSLQSVGEKRWPSEPSTEVMLVRFAK
jgi:hypothetical protein